MINTAEFNSRVEKILKHYGLSASAFAEKISVQRSSISHILSGRNKPSLDFIDKVLHAFPEIDLLWLLSGKGQLHCDNTLDQSTVEKSTVEKPLVETQLFTSSIINNSEDIDRIVIFFQDGSFNSYKMNT